MAEYLEKFKASPLSFKRGFYFLISAWISHFVFIYLFFSKGGEVIPQKILIQQAAIGGLMMLFVFMVKKWARVLCILCNILIVVLYGAVFLIVYTNKVMNGICILTTVLFLVSTYYLVKKDTGDYFKKLNPDDPDDTDEPNELEVMEKKKMQPPKKNKKQKKKK